MRTEEEMVAYALEVDASLLAHVPELLADLEELGSNAELIVQVLRELDLPEDSRVIDLGCGKGATAVEIADELGYRVLGVDLFEPFVEACRLAANAAGVSELCEFRHGNILKLAGAIEPADIVVFSALGDVLGSLDATVGVIRGFAKPGGVILISDGYLKEGASADFPGFDNYVGHDESIRRLTVFGDSLEREVAEPASAVAPDGHDESTLIRARAELIAQRHPELRRDLLGFAEDQAAEYAFLEANFASVLWVLRACIVVTFLTTCAGILGGRAAMAEDWRFVDVTEQAGIDHVQGLAGVTPGSQATKFANGIAGGDFDRDGWVDLFATPGTTGPNRLYRNLGDGTFEDVAAAAGVAEGPAPHAGPALVDLDGDGWLDLWVGGIGTGIRLHRNRGDGTFEEVSAGSGLPVFALALGPAFADVDGDRDLDVFVPQWNDAPAELLWANQGGFTFSPATLASFAGRGPEALLFTFTPNFTDLDGDGHLDLVVASDYDSSQVFLARGDGTFDVATDPAVIVDENGMGASIGDYDGDGHLDWFVGSIHGANRIYGNRLYRGRGDGTFEDATAEAGVADGGWAWGSCFGDFDNDGRLDLFQVNGWDLLAFDRDPPRLFMARGGAFVDEAAARGVADRRQGRGVVCFDFDRDGDLDLYVAHQDDRPVLWRNEGGDAAGTHLAVRLRGRSPNTEGIGARIRLTTPSGSVLVHDMRSGSNYASQNPAVAHFGLGAATAVPELSVRWPDGRRSRLLGIGAGGEVVVEEGLLSRGGFESGDLSGWTDP